MCGGPAWKREAVLDHKFDFVDVREFTDNGFGMRMKYLWLYITVLKSFLVYVSDIFTAVTMLTTNGWSNETLENCENQKNSNCLNISFSVGKWIFVGCIAFSFLLVAYEARKSKKIIASHDISYAFTNIMAQHYYSLRSYDHFCFFDHLSNSTKRSDDFAFWIFFTFKTWKQLLLADGPRQAINAITLYEFYQSKVNDGNWYDVEKYFRGNKNISTSILTVTTLFTVVIFAFGLIQLILAGIAYVPWLCYIRGNLKEYVCHKVDKRIAEVIRRRNKQRLAKAQALAKKEAAGDFSHLKNGKGEFTHQPLPQPTLPNISLDDDENDSSSMRTRVAPSQFTSQNDYYYQADYKAEYDYPQMPGYGQQYQGGYSSHNQSTTTFAEDQKMYDDDNSSTAHLALAAAPFAYQNETRPSSLPDPYATPPAHQGYMAETYDVYQGNAQPMHYASPDQHYASPDQHYASHEQRYATPDPHAGAPPYEEHLQDYPSPTSGGPVPRSLGAQMSQVQQQGQPQHGGQGGYAL
ncbi:hypothetical protein NEOLEDRAFT_1140364 [Neolentinus lepideus HHB14362 ss-1]|uniref:Vacuole protein n=1 Tax=Neolentinus lepideus HHB14362 ss-1 TaxID=1314782 RepID=A0A165PC07_9AGAM|nr:hypothetical protein NEOLEDRAFT_1140364 [Neolentinus lepideus HHB14362 ss-1]